MPLTHHSTTVRENRRRSRLLGMEGLRDGRRPQKHQVTGFAPFCQDPRNRSISLWSASPPYASPLLPSKLFPARSTVPRLPTLIFVLLTPFSESRRCLCFNHLPCCQVSVQASGDIPLLDWHNFRVSGNPELLSVWALAADARTWTSRTRAA